jgi:hypothetical protein
MFWTNQEHCRAKHKQKWPPETDNAPGRFVFDVTIENQCSHAVDRQITQTEVVKQIHLLKLLGKQAEK